MADPIERSAALVVLVPGQDAPALGRFTAEDGLLLARVAPGQMLAMREGVAPLLAELGARFGAGRVIDLSDARAAFRVAGPGAAARLAMLVPIDLHDDAFPPGACAQTMAAHTAVLLLRRGAEEYELHCGRSLAGSVGRALGGA